jgi:myosin heavy chain 9/10/11/14
MSIARLNGSSRQSNLFASPAPLHLASSSPSQQHVPNCPKSGLFATSDSTSPRHTRHQSFSPTGSQLSIPSHSRAQSTSNRNGSSTTFAPRFIKQDDSGRENKINGIEGENDFSGKRYVWLKDAEKAFVRGWVVEDLPDGRILVQCDDGSQRDTDLNNVDKVNPGKFDKADDMAELTHLNEASVVHNLHTRYRSDLIYTYSGLFLVAVNPYCSLSIYGNDYVRMYKGQAREDSRPHIFAVSDQAFRRLVEEGENQSILVTGESGAGKTENTKKVIQYLAAVATSDTPMAGRSPAKHLSNLSQQILRANPILEAFGNAQTVRNNNSSRFGKFIRIKFTRSGQIAGAFIDWYLLEKSRVVNVSRQERNYHIFYQLLAASDRGLKDSLYLTGMEVEDFAYTRCGNDTINGVSDQDEWNGLIEAFHVMNFSEKDQMSVLKTIAAVLYLGNIVVVKESSRADQASLAPEANDAVEKACILLGIQQELFVQRLLHPKVKAGREWVEKVQTPEQVRSAIDALAKGLYERAFGDLVSKINTQLDRGGPTSDDDHFIGVLDIAGFEIFENNSFEQLCINYTNEKLQQFFNHHMFVLEQEEYAREQIEWQFIDFGKDLQPTIDLIELPNPIGIFSCLDEDSVMPKATDKSFTEKLHSLWERKTPKYTASRLRQGFILTHYAAEVEYSTDGWLEKNKDPMNDNVTRLLGASSDRHISGLFSDYSEDVDELGSPRSRVKRGLFRTVAQRHKEQLASLMSQLHSTHPHFVRCILPNHKKKPKQFNGPLVLDQLRCNGVLEGIRIARTGFPNRLPFAEFRSRYEVLCQNMPKGYLDGQEAAKLILNRLKLDSSLYRVGLTKVFFRAGVLAELEEQRDSLIREIMSRFQSLARGFTQRRIANKRLYRAEATRVIQRNLNVYLDLQSNPWWKLFVRMRPMLGATRTAGEVKKRDEKIEQLQAKIEHDLEERQRIEDDRRRADIEVQRIQQTLESERALALDKEEIFKRLQAREGELSEKLADAIAEQETLEDQLDDMIDSKKKVEEELILRRTQLEQAGQIISRLEAEKKDLQQEVDELDDQLDNFEKTHSERDLKTESLDQELRMLKSQLSLKDRKLQDLEARLLKTDQDLDAKLFSANKELTGSKKQIQDLMEENRAVRKQISELSSTSTDYEDLVRRKDSELSMLRGDLRRLESEGETFQRERDTLQSRHDSMQKRLREVQAEVDAMKSQKVTLEREVSDTKRLLEAKISQDAQSGESRKMLDQQIKDLKAQLFEVQAELSRERQSRDDVQMLSEHQLTELKEKYEHLNESKITIEKEMYIQQDVLRRANEARTKADQSRKDMQAELIKLRERFTAMENARVEAENSIERNLMKQANERQANMKKEIDLKSRQLEDSEIEKVKLLDEVSRLKKAMMESENFRSHHDQHKERLERELVTVKGRLTASENDNKALLNKIQQKNLEIARSNSRAGDTQKTRMHQLQSEKNRLEEENKKLAQQVTDASLSITSLEKQKEKLALSLEDLNHEMAREHKTSRAAEKASSVTGIQLAEANRNLESERQLKTQAQANTRKLQASLEQANKEVDECRQQLMLLQKVFSQEVPQADLPWEAAQAHVSKIVDLARLVEALHTDLRTSEEKHQRAENQLGEMRKRYAEDLSDLDNKYTQSKRAMLEEIDQNQVSGPNGIRPPRKTSNAMNRFSVNTTPNRGFIAKENIAPDSGRSDRTIDTVAFQNKMDYATELEELQNQLQMTQMQNRHLQAQLDRASPVRDGWQDDSPSVRRVQKLERENGRLQDKLDDSAKKVSALERSIRNGELTFRDVQAKSHEELYDLINLQEQSRKSLLHAHNTTISDLTVAKAHFDKIKHAKAATEVELRDMRSELKELQLAKDQDDASRAQLLEEFSDLQIRLDTETSKVVDLSSSLSLYKTRADEYFNKLEQAEIAVLKASRAESFAKSQAKEAEDTCATIMTERKQMDRLVEDLQRQVQSYEEKLEDMVTDLDGVRQAKKRLQHELEDYRSQRAMDVEDKETSMEQARKRYQMEFSTLSDDLELERQNVIHERQENTRLREELEDLRSKWDDEVLNSSTWAKEKSRMELTLQDLAQSRDEATAAHNDAQTKVASLLSQVRNLRTSLDDAAAERDMLLKEKRSLESRLAEATDRLEDLANDGSPSMRNAAGMDRDLLDLKSKLAQQEDIAAAAVGKMRRAEALATEMQKDVAAERENNVQLFKSKSALEKQLKEVQLRCVDLETKNLAQGQGGKDVRFLTGRINEVSFAARTLG